MDPKLFSEVIWNGIDWNDYPDFCDAYIVSANYNGEPLSEEEIEEIEPDLKHQLLMNHLY